MTRPLASRKPLISMALPKACSDRCSLRLLSIGRQLKDLDYSLAESLLRGGLDNLGKPLFQCGGQRAADRFRRVEGDGAVQQRSDAEGMIETADARTIDRRPRLDEDAGLDQMPSQTEVLGLSAPRRPLRLFVEAAAGEYASQHQCREEESDATRHERQKRCRPAARAMRERSMAAARSLSAAEKSSNLSRTSSNAANYVKAL
jgi:hypothetical protein